MSQSLYWRPAKPRKESSLPDTLKLILKKRYETLDCANENDVLDAGALPYLEGLADAGVDGAKELIAAIKRHEQVEIWIGS